MLGGTLKGPAILDILTCVVLLLRIVKEKTMKEILSKVEEYINTKQADKKWVAGKDFIPYAGAYYDSKEFVAGVQSLLGGWLAMGDAGARFERKFPSYFGKEYGILTNSGSSSNLLMMSTLTSKRGYNLPRGTKVLMPIAGFPTTLNPTLQVGFEPVFLDIELDTLNLDLTRAEDLIKKHDIRVITFAHVLGNPPNMDHVMELVRRYGLILLEDCCDALGSTYNGAPLGSFGEMASCSFYPAHHMTMGEGGFVSCKTYDTMVIARSLRGWGRGCYCEGPEANKLKNGTCGKRFSEWIEAMPGEIFDHKYVYDEIGYNLKPIELQAAMGLEQLEKLPEIHSLRKRNYQLLFNIYEKYEEFFHLPRARELSDPSWFAFPLTVREDAPFSRSDIVDYLEENLIQTRPYFAGNIMLQPAYTHLMDPVRARDDYPNATYSMTHTYFHGTSPVITPEQIAYIGEKVDGFMSLYLW
jgi:CDP-4-dehydro-6-deoxyglucose reductase, E1